MITQRKRKPLMANHKCYSYFIQKLIVNYKTLDAVIDQNKLTRVNKLLSIRIGANNFIKLNVNSETFVGNSIVDKIDSTGKFLTMQQIMNQKLPCYQL